jgi:FMN phosphatase YigB (HAD superfamily)
MLNPAPLVFLLDVDNTLLDNDRFSADLTDCLQKSFGLAGADRYWAIHASLREENGYADYLGALQLFRADHDGHPALLGLSGFLLDYPFSQRFYPRALAVMEYLRTMGTTVILSDGDIVFQPRKIQRSGLWDAVDGRVLVCLHKELVLDQIEQRFPARHYVMIDDKQPLLALMKRLLGRRLTTVLVRQGHYNTADAAAIYPPPDMSLAHIGGLFALTMADFQADVAEHLAHSRYYS